MSTTVSVRTGTATAHRTRTAAVWILQLGLAAMFLGGGLAKVAGDVVMVEMFADIGAGQWLRYVVGALEIAGGIGLLIPRLAGLAAVGLALLMVGATVTNVTVLATSPVSPLVLLLVAGLVAWLRRGQLTTLATSLGYHRG